MTVKTWNDRARRSLAAAEEGQTLVEYALIIVLISIGTIGAMTFLQGEIGGLFSQVGSLL
jgi:Flp pilus assembly pilin Flp